jgi:hypothetical protein
MADDEALFRPVIEFDRDSIDFVLGYEAGILDARLGAKPATWRGTYHAANAEMLRRVARAHRYDATIMDSGDPNWIFADFAPSPPAIRLVRDDEHSGGKP